MAIALERPRVAASRLRRARLRRRVTEALVWTGVAAALV